MQFGVTQCNMELKSAQSYAIERNEATTRCIMELKPDRAWQVCNGATQCNVELIPQTWSLLGRVCCCCCMQGQDFKGHSLPDQMIFDSNFCFNRFIFPSPLRANWPWRWREGCISGPSEGFDLLTSRCQIFPVYKYINKSTYCNIY